MGTRLARMLAAGAVVPAILALTATVVLAYDEPGGMPEEHVGDCAPCHRPGPPLNTYCLCHPPHGPMTIQPTLGKGPHGLYNTTTARCSACHAPHVAGGAKLLPASTVTDTCYTCHDGTGGRGVYGAITARGLTVGATHRIDQTNLIPGGNASTGATSTGAFKGAGANLGCSDCHSPHDASAVATFTGERWRNSYTLINWYGVRTSKLLRQRPGGSVTTQTAYGSDWCLACHAGRASGGAVHNHPVDSRSTHPTAFTYDLVARLSTEAPTSTTTTGTLAGSHRGYLMPYPRTPQQGGHKPICQQCHEDSRYVGTLNGNVGDAAPFEVTLPDGEDDWNNPQFQNFPHETVNDRMLVETDDDLCLNCHPVTGLP